MINDEEEKVMIVEGVTDKRRVESIIIEDILIICTYGTLGVERFDELLYEYDLDNRDVYILVDEDTAGINLRKQLSHELPHAEHIYINGEYREVATTPHKALAIALASKGIDVNPFFLRF